MFGLKDLKEIAIVLLTVLGVFVNLIIANKIVAIIIGTLIFCFVYWLFDYWFEEKQHKD